MHSNRRLPRRRILLFAKRFAEGGESHWLTDELAQAFVKDGAEVDVALLDTAVAGQRNFSQRLPIVVRRYYEKRKWFSGDSFASRLLSLFPVVVWMHFAEMVQALRRRYDVAVLFSVGSLFGLLPLILVKLRVTRHLVFVLWDFFPGHHVEIGRVPKFLINIVKPLETSLIRAADVVCVMSESNGKAAVDYFGVDPDRLIVVPPWGVPLEAGRLDPPMKSQSGEPLRLVFGGQLGRGRRVDWLIDQVLSSSMRQPVDLSIIGEISPELENVVQRARDAGASIGTHPWMERAKYLELIASADVGVVVTDDRVGFPTYPSKLVDYFRVGLPALVCVEQASDVAQLVESRGMGLSTGFASPSEFDECIARLTRLRDSGELLEMGERAEQYFAEFMDVRQSAIQMLDAIEGHR